MSEGGVLSAERTAELIRAAQSGDETASEELVRANIPLVRSIIRGFMNRGTEYEDLLQIGCLGLVKAIKNFNTDYGVRFSTYAVPMIAGEIKRYLRDDGMIKVSRTLKETASRAAAARERLSHELCREPTVEELASDIGEEVESVVLALDAARPHISIYEPAYGEDSDALLIDNAADECDATGEALDKVMIKELLRVLTPRERQLIMLRFFLDKTQQETASVMGVSQVQISRMEGKIMQKLRAEAK